jgi:hypothetical protein
MPFVSEAQRAWMWANRPKQAAEWEKHTPTDAKLPERVSEKRKQISDANPALVSALKRIQNRK